jgi:hypothetical protein
MALTPVALAQDGTQTITLMSGEPEVVQITPGQTVTATFSALTGDSFNLRVIRLGAFNYSATLTDPAGTATNLLPDESGSIGIAQSNNGGSGLYTLSLQASDTGGEVLIRLDVLSTTPPPALARGQTRVDLGAVPLRFLLPPLAGETTGYTRLTIEMIPPTTTDLGTLPAITLLDTTSHKFVLQVEAGQTPYTRITLRLPTTYQLEIAPVQPAAQALITWELLPPPGSVPLVTFTPVPTPTAPPTLTPAATATPTITITPNGSETATATLTATTDGDMTETPTWTPTWTETPTMEEPTQETQ